MSTLLKDLNLAEMNVSQLRSAIAERYTEAKAIEDRHENGLTQDSNHEDYAEVKRLLGELDVMEDKLGPLEEADARKARIQDNLTAYSKPTRPHQHPAQTDSGFEVIESPGDQFVKSQAFRDLIESGVLSNPRNQLPHTIVQMQKTNFLDMSRKALVTSGTGSGGSLIFNDVRPGVLDILQRGIVLMDLLPRSSTNSDTIEYVRETTFTNNAAFTAEATGTTGTSGTKPESVLVYDTQTATVKTLAHWIPVTNKMLSDAPMIRGMINQRLLLGLDLALESQVIDGDGAGENFTGILRTAGICIESGGASVNPMDALYKGRTQVMVTGLGRPSAYVLHPNDLQAIRLARENSASATLGAYLMGPPMLSGPTMLWGLPVVESLAEPENTGLIGDWAMGLTFFDREQSQIRVGTINDQFVRNMQTILAELRAALIVWRPSAFCKVTGI